MARLFAVVVDDDETDAETIQRTLVFGLKFHAQLTWRKTHDGASRDESQAHMREASARFQGHVHVQEILEG